MRHRPQRFGRHPSFRRIVGGILLVLTTSLAAYGSDGGRRPNVVLILADNVGIGEVGAFGAARGVPTPSLDRLGTEGLRLTNFNVEYSCVVSRIALLTGRYAVRSGNGDEATGMTLWETTIAEGLRTQGYATGLFGKWHVGGSDWLGKREPTNQGFDEWYGIPGTSHVSQFPSFDGFPSSGEEVPLRLGGPHGRSRHTREALLARCPTNDRPGSGGARDSVHAEERAKRNPLLLVLPDDAASLSHASPPRFRRQDRSG